MEFTNYLYDFGERQKAQWNIPVGRSKWKQVIENLLVLISPIAPHITEELWVVIGNEFSIHKQVWPKYDEEIARNEIITLVVQVNGKVRDKIIAPADIDEDHAKALALSSNRVKTNIYGKEILKVILVPGRLINLVVQ